MPEVTDKLNNRMLYRVHLIGARFELTTSVVIDTDCIDHDGPYQYSIIIAYIPDIK